MDTYPATSWAKLDFHTLKYHFRATLNPLCAINEGAEDTEHYFLRCHAYDASRRRFLGSLNTILLSQELIRLSNEELLKVTL